MGARPYIDCFDDSSLLRGERELRATLAHADHESGRQTQLTGLPAQRKQHAGDVAGCAAVNSKRAGKLRAELRQFRCLHRKAKRTTVLAQAPLRSECVDACTQVKTVNF